MIRLVLALLLLASPAAAQTQFVCERPSTTDGDTFRCASGTRVRVWGIQAPERADPGGPASSRRMAELLAGQTLRCEPKGKSYNRVVAQCFTRQGRDIAAEMVRSGHALDWPEFSRGAYAR
jgi:endonuclease YncB( thermonuclease family)